MNYQGHYGLEFALKNSDSTIEEMVTKLEAKQNRTSAKVRKIHIRERDLPVLNLMQREKAIGRQRSVERRREQYMK